MSGTPTDRTSTSAHVSRKDRAIARIVAFISRLLYREVTVHWTVPPPTSGPELTVSNHFGGLADGIVLVHVLPRRPGIIARDVIWKVPVVGRLMTWIGGIPVHKREDGDRPAGNAEMFGSCFDALREGRHLLIFPEGVTRNEPSIARVRSGAARIALGAHDAGVRGVVITPIGIHYADKAALRSRIVVLGGRPIAVDELPPVVEDESDDRERVVRLTAEIDERLRDAAPDFADWDEARTLGDAADIALRTQLDDPSSPVPEQLRVRLANALAHRTDEQRARIVDATRTYRSELDRAGVSDLDIVGGPRRTRALVALQLVAGLLLVPFALVGVLVNLLPFLVVRTVGRLRVAPSMQSTIKPIAAVVAFGITWAVVLWWAAATWGLSGAAVAVFLLPVYLWATVIVTDRLSAWWTSHRSAGRHRSVPSGASVVETRDAVVREVFAR